MCHLFLAAFRIFLPLVFRSSILMCFHMVFVFCFFSLLVYLALSQLIDSIDLSFNLCHLTNVGHLKKINLTLFSSLGLWRYRSLRLCSFYLSTYFLFSLNNIFSSLHIQFSVFSTLLLNPSSKFLKIILYFSALLFPFALITCFWQDFYFSLVSRKFIIAC